ncbi:hypothetical protein F8M41_007008 [Gigaspora margarita]|uniref:Uncharacterized protein n=1 Tax=Gigaspora margarita TaxID=4874 RepID=A0A8H3X687_GIGMA|nr:hypothetical protein F8M41_007008 [Gigaspora margarita]
MKNLMCFQNVYFFVIIKDETDNDYTNDLDVVKIFEQCYEEEKTKDLMEFLKSKGANTIGTISRKSDEEYGNMGFKKNNSEGSNPEEVKDFMGFMEEFANSDFVKNKYGEGMFEFNLFAKPNN